MKLKLFHMARYSFFIILSLISLVACQGKSSVKNETQTNDNQLEYKVFATAEDSLIFNNLIDFLKDKELSTQNRITEIARFFLETPYVASTLELEGDEQLVINLREMDCTTFVEYVLALTLCTNNNCHNFSDFKRHLANIRYNNGVIDGYPSRLHYFTDWLVNNQQKGILEIVSDSIGDIPLKPDINFMSSHAHLYKQLDNEQFLEDIKAREIQISNYQVKFIPKNSIDKIEHLILDGDIIALVTNVKGLDVSHVGLAIHQNGRLHFIHASSTEKKVVITNESLHQYLVPQKRIDGILVGRVNLQQVNSY